mmetsp:Transcript_27889/g.50453  ORF Transcript_27889/g.50453 Transcript_27889/m.50453 type:complete len:178 (-) Transcript_27889:263-796(-)|eukprot:CAMPEP_0201882150 /NCGR_PEP_ID=MMETSP0902-20130614/13375_1 /ASSEMBLY_ACC=CAM_ASM_000551 /TAXON_ID=420261 /ORGANISM="Thalassiosira antarctica, Strain CCMP982" /LENGTH=177 /DNA_ID=CAMNT_0048410561 /DNA_START=103 /DNA_END=636 /DNA_ORIENTATION=+
MIPTMKCNVTIITIALALLLVATTPIGVASFQLHRSTPVTGRAMTNAMRPFTSLHSENPNKGSDTPREDEIIGEQYEGSVDWDSEWKKVVEDRDQPSERPGKYKSQAEITAIKATNKVAKNVYDASREAKKNLPSAPDIRSLKGDWRFWIGILLVFSFGLSILSATASAPANESFYI